jgi:hypothetical protein
VLRVAAEEIVRRYANVHYFASYEIITTAKNAGAYFAEDARSITTDGVARAMDLFFAHFTDQRPVQAASVAPPLAQPIAQPVANEPRIICDEDDFYRALAASRAH